MPVLFRLSAVGVVEEVDTCATEAPESLREVKVDGPRSYGANSVNVVRMQLYKGGVRLAAMLNAIYSD